jgi:hypothetical protein
VRPDVDPVVKLKAIFDSRPDKFARTIANVSSESTTPDDYSRALVKMLHTPLRIDFLPYELDDIDGPGRGPALLSLILEKYSDEMEDIQAEIGNGLRRALAFLKAFAPELDFLSEISRDSYSRRPLERLRQMMPSAIFSDMSLSEDAVSDALLDALETSFVPVVPDLASTVDNIRNVWFRDVKFEDERDELIFYEILERAVTHAVASESRAAETRWALGNFDGDALLLGLFDICSKALESLEMFCSNCKYIIANRPFIDALSGDET